MSKKRLAGATALLLTYLATGARPAIAVGLNENLPSMDKLVRYGCSVRGPLAQIDHRDRRGRVRQVWSVTFWAEHMSTLGSKIRKDWKLLYSFRKKRSKGLSDCDKFMKRVKKARRVKVNVAGGSHRSGEAVASATRAPND